jgi:hypothetical protein
MAVAIRGLPWVVHRDATIQVDVELWSVGTSDLPAGGEGPLNDLRGYVRIEFPEDVGFPVFDTGMRGLGSCQQNVVPLNCYPGKPYHSGEYFRIDARWNAGNRARNSIRATAGLEGAMARRIIESNTANYTITVSTR